ncbi:MAG: histidine kinase dimerization/phosphoacceptor domain -containing protein, partial [Elusimicrobia bacterium]|nr:histidine kinase dimerization/phosphoacceptor domain -containing protein [Elusimicrobiota bacterium]
YYFDEHEKAADALAGVRRCLAGLTDNVLKRQWYVFQALNALKLHERRAGTDGADTESVRAEIAPLVAEVETWAGLGPLLKPYLAFLHAERERVCGRFERARGLYLDAIESAHRHRYIFLEGHLNECLGEMQLANGRGPARPFLIEAARLYRRCRAERKEQRLYDRHPEYFEAEAAPPAAEVEATGAPSYALPQLDVGYLMRSALAISAEIEQEALLRRIMQTVIESSGAQHGYMLVAEGDHLRVRAESHAGGDGTVRTVNQRLEAVPGICAALVRYVLRTAQRVVLADASREGEFQDNPQVRALGLRSVLCLPVVKQARLIGALYLENRLAPAMFTPAGIQTTELLAAQAAISLENARLVEEMKSAEEELARERENLAVTLHSIGDAVIAADTESRVIMINRVAEGLTGWSQGEACGRPLGDVFRIENEKTGEPAEDPVRKALESGAVVGLANHTVLVSRDGRRFAIADSAAPIRGKGGGVLGVVLVFRDVTDERQAERERDVTIELLRIVNTSPDTAVLIDGVTRFFQEISGCEAVGVRLRDGCDYPYYASRGFPQEFVLAENRLGMRDDAGIAVKDGVGNPLLDCMCGNVICGRYDASKLFFTARGSFWTNSTTELLSATTAADRLDRMRDRCNGEGHESVALIALRVGDERLGLLQLNGRRKGLFSPAIIEAWERLADYLAVALAKANAEEALRASLAEKEILLKELAHRTKNNMQVIGGLISLQGSASADKKLLDALADTQDRIRAMALVHETLYRSGNFSSLNMKDYVEDLIKTIFRAQRGAGGPIRRNLDVEDILVSIDAALPCGLIINELVSNSLKHAFPDRKAGAIYLSLRRRGQTTELRYRDDGPGLPPGLDLARIKSLGLKLVYNLAVRQLRGTMEIRHDPVTEFVFAFDGFAHMERM